MITFQGADFHQSECESTLKIQKGEEFKIIFDCLFFLVHSKKSSSQNILKLFFYRRGNKRALQWRWFVDLLLWLKLRPCSDYPCIAFALVWKLDWRGLQFRLEKGDLGVISVTEQNCPVPISKVKCHILDRFCGTLLCSVNSYSFVVEVDK